MSERKEKEEEGGRRYSEEQTGEKRMGVAGEKLLIALLEKALVVILSMELKLSVYTSTEAECEGIVRNSIFGAIEKVGECGCQRGGCKWL